MPGLIEREKPNEINVNNLTVGDTFTSHLLTGKHEVISIGKLDVDELHMTCKEVSSGKIVEIILPVQGTVYKI
jgi:hypothetical protein